MKRKRLIDLKPLDEFAFAPYSFEPHFILLGFDKVEFRFEGVESKETYSIPYDPLKKVYFYEKHYY